MTIAPYARAAFAAGYAEILGAPLPVPLSTRVSLSAAVAAAEVEDIPAVLHLVRETGRREGVYATVQTRLDALETRWQAQLQPVLDALGPLIAAPIADALVGAPAADHAMEVANPLPPDTDPQQAVQDVLDGLTGAELWQQWEGVLVGAWQEAQAEGTVDAGAFLAALTDGPMPAWDVEFAQALAHIRSLPTAYSDLDTWMGQQTHGLAYQLGNALADAIEQGGTHDTLLQIVLDQLDLSETQADLMLNHLINQGVTAGSLDRYALAGLAEVDFLTSPGACPECEDAEEENPYELTDAPQPPLHPRCRCTLAPALDLPD